MPTVQQYSLTVQVGCPYFEATRRKYNTSNNNLEEVMKVDESSIRRLINFFEKQYKEIV